MTPVLVWLAGVATVIVAPIAVYVGWRSKRQRLPRSRALVKGDALPLETVDEAIMAFKAEMPLDSDRLLIELRPGDFFKHPSAPGLRLSGITLGPKNIIVAVPKGRPVGGIALFHELMHAHMLQQGKTAYDEDDHQSWNGKHWDVVDRLKRRFK